MVGGGGGGGGGGDGEDEEDEEDAERERWDVVKSVGYCIREGPEGIKEGIGGACNRFPAVGGVEWIRQEIGGAVGIGRE